MADASCSGTTPFKRLVDHQARDVSHQQDRLVSSSTAPGYGSFRSAPQPGQGQDQFQAFMNGTSTFSGLPQPHDSAARLSAHAAALRHAPTPPFVSSAPLPPQFESQARASPVGDVANWAADFASFNSRQQRPFQPPQTSMSQPQTQQFSQPMAQPNFHAAFGLSNPGFQGFAANTFPAAGVSAAPQPEFDAELSRWMASHGSGAGMEQVDAAMEQMARELELNEAALAEAEIATSQQKSSTTESAQNLHEAHFTDLETPEIGNLSLDSRNEQETVPVEENGTPNEQSNARSAVSEAAERLLESVQGEQGQKWKNSTFLSLMRDFRDGRKDIVDNEIRQTEGGDGSSGGAADARCLLVKP